MIYVAWGLWFESCIKVGIPWTYQINFVMFRRWTIRSQVQTVSVHWLEKSREVRFLCPGSNQRNGEHTLICTVRKIIFLFLLPLWLFYFNIIFLWLLIMVHVLTLEHLIQWIDYFVFYTVSTILQPHNCTCNSSMEIKYSHIKKTWL